MLVFELNVLTNCYAVVGVAGASVPAPGEQSVPVLGSQREGYGSINSVNSGEDLLAAVGSC